MRTSLANDFGVNLIMNPLHRFGQRALTQSGISNADATPYILDRFRHNLFGNAIHEVSRVPAIIPEERFVQYAYRTEVTTGAANTATTLSQVTQRIEGNYFYPVIGKDVTLSFWVRSNVTGTYCVNFKNDGRDDTGVTDATFISEYTISQANTWEKKVIKVRIDPTRDWKTNEENGLEVAWVLDSGSDYYAAPDSWLSTNDFSTSNQVNLDTTTGNYFEIAGIKLHEGIEEIPFEYIERDAQKELQLCQRFFRRLEDFYYTKSVAPSFQGYHYIKFSPSMRDIPICSAVASGFNNTLNNNVLFDTVTKDGVNYYIPAANGSVNYVGAFIESMDFDAEL